jgi:hypothetical protein
MEIRLMVRPNAESVNTSDTALSPIPLRNQTRSARLPDRGKEYTSADGRVETLGKTLTRPAVRDRGKVSLTLTHLERHFSARGPEDLVGLHTTSPANTSLWGAVEVDRHGEQGNSPEANLAAVLAWYGRLVWPICVIRHKSNLDN